MSIFYRSIHKFILEVYKWFLIIATTIATKGAYHAFW